MCSACFDDLLLFSSQGVNEEPEDKHEREQYVASHFKSPEQISNELVTLSLLPRSRWHSLLNLDVIKVHQNLDFESLNEDLDLTLGLG